MNVNVYDYATAEVVEGTLVKEFKNGKRDVVLADGRKVRVTGREIVERCVECSEFILPGTGYVLRITFGVDHGHYHTECNDEREARERAGKAA